MTYNTGPVDYYNFYSDANHQAIDTPFNRSTTAHFTREKKKEKAAEQVPCCDLNFQLQTDSKKCSTAHAVNK